MLDSLLRRVVAEEFRLKPEEVTDDLSPDTLDEWTSLSHMRLVVALEEAFKTTFTNEQVMDMTSVAAIREILAGRGSPP